METSIVNSLVRIFSANDDKAYGMGFLVTNRHIVTAAHVISSMPDIDKNSAQAPNNLIEVDFPLSDYSGQRLLARIVQWKPEINSQVIDFCMLEILSHVPDFASIARLITTPDIQNLPFEVFGVPTGYSDGVWVKGIIRRVVANGLVQIEGVDTLGYFLEPGFSGSGVFCETVGGIVGMVVTSERDPNVRAGFMLPSHIMIEAISQIEPSIEAFAYTRPPAKSEKLISNLLKVEYHAKTIYIAPATYSHWTRISQAAGDAGLTDHEWILKGDNIISF